MNFHKLLQCNPECQSVMNYKKLYLCIQDQHNYPNVNPNVCSKFFVKSLTVFLSFFCPSYQYLLVLDQFKDVTVYM